MSHEMSHEEYIYQKNLVWKVTGILAVVTVVEVGIALLYDHFLGKSGYRGFLNVFMIVASLIKAAYIVGVFMHVKYENHLMKLTILAPLLFFIWFIIAFLMEGEAWNHAIGG